jgi:hypothetical protein
MSNLEWNRLELVQLMALYKKEANSLKQQLLNGTGWEELKEKRDIVTELAAAIHKKNIESGNPPEKGLVVIDRPFKEEREG